MHTTTKFAKNHLKRKRRVFFCSGIHGGRFTFDRNQDGLQSYGLRTYVKLKDKYIWVRAGLFKDGSKPYERLFLCLHDSFLLIILKKPCIPHEVLLLFLNLSSPTLRFHVHKNIDPSKFPVELQ